MIRQFSHAEFTFLLQGALWTILLSLIAFAGGGIGGLFIALARTSGKAALVLPAQSFIRIIQSTPLLMQIFLIFFGIGAAGLHVDPLFAASLALTMNTSALLGEIWRGSIQAVSRGQTEAAESLGLKYWQVMVLVVLPQALRIAIPPTVGFSVQVIKATSVTAMIGFTEVTRAGQIVNNATFRPFLVFGLVAVIYFVLCWPLTKLSARLELKLRAGAA